MLNGGSMVWGFCVYFVYMIPLETDVLRKHHFQKSVPAITATTASYVCRPRSPTLCFGHPVSSTVAEIVTAVVAGDIV